MARIADPLISVLYVITFSAIALNFGVSRDAFNLHRLRTT